jgi:hypothetical protein
MNNICWDNDDHSMPISSYHHVLIIYYKIFDDNEHDALACAHVVIIDGNEDNNDDFVVVDDPNNNDNDNNNNNDNNIGDEPIRHFSEQTLCVTRDKVTAVYAVTVVVINKKFKASNCVHTINNIIEYVDALICKFNNLGLASARELYLALEHSPNRINNMLTEAGYSKLHMSTINLLHPTAQSVNRFVGITILSL